MIYRRNLRLIPLKTYSFKLLSFQCFPVRRWGPESWDGAGKDEAPLFYQGVDDFTEKAREDPKGKEKERRSERKMKMKMKMKERIEKN